MDCNCENCYNAPAGFYVEIETEGVMELCWDCVKELREVRTDFTATRIKVAK